MVNWKEELSKTSADVLWIVSVSIAVIIIIVAGNWAWTRYGPSNEQRVLKKFVYSKLTECTEKLAAYGEDVDLVVTYDDATLENLDVCVEKLGAYGEDVKPIGL